MRKCATASGREEASRESLLAFATSDDPDPGARVDEEKRAQRTPVGVRCVGRWNERVLEAKHGAKSANRDAAEAAVAAGRHGGVDLQSANRSATKAAVAAVRRGSVVRQSARLARVIDNRSVRGKASAEVTST